MENFDIEIQQDENLRKFNNREHNVLRGPIALVREIRNGYELSGVYYGEELSSSQYMGRYYPQKKKVEKQITPEEIRNENRVKIPEDVPPKSTGGQEAYVKLLVKNKKSVRGLSMAASAILLQMCFGGIQWNTGKLMQERSRKPHTVYTIAKLINACVRTTVSALKELAEKNIINYDKNLKIYFMSIDIARKGAVIENADKV
jgi:hypothetical protein